MNPIPGYHPTGYYVYETASGYYAGAPSDGPHYTADASVPFGQDTTEEQPDFAPYGTQFTAREATHDGNRYTGHYHLPSHWQPFAEGVQNRDHDDSYERHNFGGAGQSAPQHSSAQSEEYSGGIADDYHDPLSESNCYSQSGRFASAQPDSGYSHADSGFAGHGLDQSSGSGSDHAGAEYATGTPASNGYDSAESESSLHGPEHEHGLSTDDQQLQVENDLSNETEYAADDQELPAEDNHTCESEYAAETSAFDHQDTEGNSSNPDLYGPADAEPEDHPAPEAQADQDDEEPTLADLIPEMIDFVKDVAKYFGKSLPDTVFFAQSLSRREISVEAIMLLVFALARCLNRQPLRVVQLVFALKTWLLNADLPFVFSTKQQEWHVEEILEQEDGGERSAHHSLGLEAFPAAEESTGPFISDFSKAVSGPAPYRCTYELDALKFERLVQRFAIPYRADVHNLVQHALVVGNSTAADMELLFYVSDVLAHLHLEQNIIVRFVSGFRPIQDKLPSTLCDLTVDHEVEEEQEHNANTGSAGTEDVAEDENEPCDGVSEDGGKADAVQPVEFPLGQEVSSAPYYQLCANYSLMCAQGVIARGFKRDVCLGCDRDPLPSSSAHYGEPLDAALTISEKWLLLNFILGFIQSLCPLSDTYSDTWALLLAVIKLSMIAVNPFWAVLFLLGLHGA